jgi:NADPH:quinone reductase-like Zn-dependent oxidoreductase
MRALAPDGVDRVLDTAGRGALPDLIEITGTPEHVITIADPDAAKYGARVSTGAERAVHALGEVSRLFEADRFQMPIARTFPLDQAGEAHRLSEAGHIRGKVVLTP